MSQFTFDLATPADDNQLRQLVAATPMDGAIKVTFAREPSYFGAAAVDGTTVQIIVVRESQSGQIVGMGSRSISMRYVNGQPAEIGYLGGLRILPEHRRKAGILARGYRFLHDLHADRRVPYYLTTITADNRPAMSLLTSGRAGLPVYHSVGNFHTMAISTAHRSHNSAARKTSLETRTAQVDDRDAILTFLNEHGKARQFFPAYEEVDLFSGGGKLKGLRPEDIFLAKNGNQIVGTLGCWNQRSFKQILVGYDGWLSRARPIYNVWASLCRRPTLPVSGSILPVSLAAVPVVCDDDLDKFRKIFLTMLDHLRGRGEQLLLVGLHEAHPLLPVVRRFAGREYLTRLYIVYWPTEAPDIGQLERRIPYLELGAL
jgi:hypothetical protein